MNIINWILDHKWAITPTALDVVLSIVNKDQGLTSETIAKSMHGQEWEKLTSKNALEAFNYPILEGTRRVSFTEGIGILPIVGPIFPRSNLMTMSGGVSVQSLAHDFNKAINNPEVKGIILNIDSPGGEITGIGEFADQVFEARKKMPIIAYAYGMAASAGYWLASSTSEIVASPTAELGSIGVIAGYTDKTAEEEKKGRKKIEIVSSQSPFKNLSPTEASGKALIQDIVNKMAEVFINSVAKYRGITTEEVINNYGQGKVFVGETAVKQGLADRIGSLEEIITELKNRSNKSLSYNNLTGVKNMDIKTLKEKYPSLYAEVLEIGKKEALEDVETRVEAARKEGVNKENARIKAIEELNVPGAEKIIAESKFDTKKNAQEIAVEILKAQKDDLKKINAGLSKDGKELAKKSKDLGQDEVVDSQSEEEKAAINGIKESIKKHTRR